MMDSLLANQRTQALIDRTSARMATGRDVNTVLDNPQNYFAAKGLNNTAADLTRRLDGIGQSIKTINQALDGTDSAEELLRLGESIALRELEKRRSGTEFGGDVTPVVPLDQQITAAAPQAYWRLNEASGGTSANLGSLGLAVDGTYRNGATLGAAPLYDGGGSSVAFNGTNQYVDIPGNNAINLTPQNERSVELVFNANTTAGRQVLYEEGGNVNSLTIYIDNGQLHVVGRDSGAWGPQTISVPINAGETYHVGFSMSALTGEFIGYANGVEMGRDTVTATFPRHTGFVAVGGQRNGAWYHTGAQTGDRNYFEGRISDVALYNRVLEDFEFEDHAEAVVGDIEISTENINFSQTMDQLTQLVGDSSYQGVNLLEGGILNSILNEDGSHKYVTEGTNLTSEGLGIEREGFDTVEGILAILDDVREAVLEVRAYRRALSIDFGILATRETFAMDRINEHIVGADKLTLADLNKESANLLALQTRQSLSITSLSLAGESSRSILQVLET
jgi:flagellin